MAKRKLSLKKRQSVRKDISRLISHGKKQADILRKIATKYGIKPITARWYYKDLAKPGKKPSRLKIDTSKTPRPKIRQSRLQPSNRAMRIVHQIQTIMAKKL